MTAAAKSTPVLKSLNGLLWNSRPQRDWGKVDVTGEENGQVHPDSHRGRGPGIRGKICRDNAGKELDAAGAHSNLQGLWIRAYGRVKQRI
jgi:hypothetical protein